MTSSDSDDECMAPTDFPFTGFHDTERAARTVVKLHELFIASGAAHPLPEFSHALARALPSTPDPDLAVTNLLRFVEATLNKAALLNDLVRHAVLMDVLTRIVASSQYFADILVRDPELFRWLTASDSLVAPRSTNDLHAEVKRTMSLFQKPERKLDALKRLYRREVLRIGTRDILGEADLPAATAELSLLADMLVDAACTLAHEQLADRYPRKPGTPYAVIGLGKLGGKELNYSSDIDLIFVYEDEGELEDATGRTRTYHEYFNAFVERMVVNLTQSTAEGHLYRVDLRLRPESGAGPLARSMQSYLLYYESRGELWERQMLIKARPVAGDPMFGNRFIVHLEPFVYPRTFFEDPKSSIARIKARIEAELAGEENVKLRAGGIRDIEFIVQALQLLNGGKNKAIRSRNTLHAIGQLHKARLLADEERSALTEAYVFFRTVEHRLQMMLNTQTHALPGDDHSLRILARKTGLRSVDEFRAKNSELLAGVKRIFRNVLSAGPGNTDVTLDAALSGNTAGGVLERVLARYNFADTRKAAKNLGILASGSALLGTQDLDARARDAFRSVAGDLFEAIRETPVPDATLHNLAHISSSHPFPEQLYTQLREDNFRNLVLTVCSTSGRIAKGLARHPLVLESVSVDPQMLGGVSLESPLPARSPVTLKMQEELRAGIRYILGITAFDELTAELTQLADVIVYSVVSEELKKMKKQKSRLAVMALGKYGTREINFDSDLDVLFVGDAGSGTERDKLEKTATRIVQRLSSINEEGKLYDIDARLRPEGQNAPLTVESNAYASYLTTRASLWERQSLTRMRFVAGHRELGEEILRTVNGFVYDSPLPPNWVENIVAMRRKMETRSRVSGTPLLDIKLGSGGMVDIEFLVQMVQLKLGRTHNAFRRLATPAVLDQLAGIPGIREQAVSLRSAYSLYRRIETYLRITLEERGTILPDEEKLETLARHMGTDGGKLHREVASTMTDVRRTFLDLSSRIATLDV